MHRRLYPLSIGIDNNFSDAVVQPLKTLYADVGHSQNLGLFGDNYDFKEIQSVVELFEEENDIQVWFDNSFFKVSTNTEFSSEAKQALESQKWVLRFCETPVTASSWGEPPVVGYTVHRTRISDVIILRLHFKSQGKEYNLGVVDNKQTGSLDPLAQTQTTFDLSDELKDFLWILLIVLGLFVLGVLLYLFSPILKLLLFILLLPFRAIGHILKKNKEDRGSSGFRSTKASRYRRW